MDYLIERTAQNIIFVFDLESIRKPINLFDVQKPWQRHLPYCSNSLTAATSRVVWSCILQKESKIILFILILKWISKCHWSPKDWKKQWPMPLFMLFKRGEITHWLKNKLCCFSNNEKHDSPFLYRKLNAKDLLNVSSQAVKITPLVCIDRLGSQ